MTNKWPKYMPVPTAEDFIHGSWVADSVGNYLLDGVMLSRLAPKDVASLDCGTRCCLVGHVRHAFGLPGDPSSDLPPQGEKFLRKFLELAGYPACPQSRSLQLYASDCFEGVLPYDDYSYNYYPQLTEEKAAKVWKKTLEHFGYTEMV